MNAVVLPQPPLYPDWVAWAQALVAALGTPQPEGQTSYIYDSLGRPLLTPEGLFIYGADGSIPVAADIVEIDTQHLADAAITTAKLAAASVDNEKLADLAVDAAKLAGSSVTAEKIANLAVGSAAIALAAIGTAHIANAAITSALIADAAIVTAKIDDLAVNSAKIANLAVGSAKIDNLAVTTLKIADLAITEAKIADLAVARAKIALAAIGSAQIEDLAVTSAKIASLAADKIVAGTIGAQLIHLGANQFELDGNNVYLRVLDALSTTRVKLGKLGVGTTDYGIEIYSASGSLIFGASGLGTSVVGTTQITPGAVTIQASDSDNGSSTPVTASVAHSSQGQPVQLSGKLTLFSANSTVGTMTATLSVKRDSTTIFSKTFTAETEALGGGQFSHQLEETFAVTDIDNGAASYTYSAVLSRLASGGTVNIAVSLSTKENVR